MRTRVGNKKLVRRNDHKRLRASVRAVLHGGSAKQVRPSRYHVRPEAAPDRDITER